VGKKYGKAIRRMRKYGAPSTTFEQQITADRDTDDDKLRGSSRIRNKQLIYQNY
jgi:hypothetical protein